MTTPNPPLSGDGPSDGFRTNSPDPSPVSGGGQWQAMEFDVGCEQAVPGTTFFRLDAVTGHQQHLRMLPWIVDHPALMEDLRHQIRFSRVVADTCSIRVVEFETSPLPPKLVIDLGLAIPISQWLVKANGAARVVVATELARHIGKTLNAGLIHGNLQANSVYVETRDGFSPNVRIDFLSRFYSMPDFETREFGSTDTAAAAELSPEKDASYLHELLVQIIQPIVSDDAFLSQFDRQTRAACLELSKRKLYSECPFTTLGHWNQLFERLAAQQAVSATLMTVVQGDATIVMDKPLTSESTTSDTNEPTREAALDSSSTQSNDQQATIEQGSTEQHSDFSGKVTSSSRSRPATPKAGDQLGHFRLDRVIGSGGMGVVFQGVDLTNDEPVAIKVLKTRSGDIAQAIRRFNKEARILASVQNEYVTRLLDAGVDQGVHYLAMEFVSGTNLKDWCRNRLPLEEPSALRVTADIARALVDAHQQEIVHRDIKPENVLLGRISGVDSSQASDTLSDYCVKLTDFGIARQIDQSVSMELTLAGSLLGTPVFMSPEQFRGGRKEPGEDSVGPAADVYAIGVTLYMLLCGQVPFQADDAMQLATLHCFEAPVPLQKRNRAISDQAAALVSKMLAKKPEDRFADAAQLLRAIEKLLGGEPNDVESHPRIPDGDAANIWQRAFEWELASRPDQLWPHVSNTERLNRAAGLRSVQYRTEKHPERGLRRFGSVRLAGMQIEWEEHPFEWVEGSRMGVLREFSSGPFKWFTSVVEVHPNTAGGTRLVHSIKILPRNTLGRAVASVEAGWKAGRSLERVYRRIDQTIQKQKSGQPSGRVIDPFEPPVRLDAKREKRIEERTARLMQHGISQTTAERLAEFLRTATPQTLARIRPLELAEQLSLDAEKTLDACLVAAHCGLLVIGWDILCPTCRVPSATQTMLSNIEAHTNCEACDVQFQSNLASAIELIFQAHPEVGDIDVATYCIGGPSHSPHVVCQLRVAAGESIEATVPLAAGDYLIRGPRLTRSQSLRVKSHSAPSQLDIRLGQLGTSHHTPAVRAGQLTLCVRNDLPTEHLVRIERAIERKNVVTAATVSTLARFRELFPDQVFKRDLPIATEDLTLFGFRVAETDQLYMSMGDADAYVLIQSALQCVEACITGHRGAVIKSVGEVVLGSFRDSADATSAALSVGDRLAEVAQLAALQFGIGLHRGPTLVTTQNGRLDYFGSTPRMVESLTQRANKTLLITDSVFSDSATNAILIDSGLTSAIVSMDSTGGPASFATSDAGSAGQAKSQPLVLEVSLATARNQRSD